MNHFQTYLAEEFVEDYQEGRISRRAALKLIGSVTGSFVLAEGFLAGCSPEPASELGLASATSAGVAVVTLTPTNGPADASATPPVGTVTANDPAVIAGPIQFGGEGATLSAYLARPSVEGRHPIVLVCHENRGLTDHIRDVARRLAKAGYVGIAVDLLSRMGGTDTVGSDNVPGVLGGISPDQFANDFLSAWRHLQGETFADTDQVGMVGFCFGGGVTWLVATRMPELRAAVPYYGPHPAVADVPSIQAVVLAIYAGRDDRINQGIPAIEAAMRENGKTYETVVYPDTDHAFHNDTGSRYDPAAAQDAWRRTIEWFGRYLK